MYKVITAALLLILSQASFSFAPPKPEKCPEATSLKSGGLRIVKYVPQMKSYAAANVGSYDTNDDWGFIVANIRANSEEEAMDKAEAALPSLSGNPRPMYVSQNNIWACQYYLRGGYYAFAVTPLDGPRAAINLTPQLIK